MQRISILGSGWLGHPLAVALSKTAAHIKVSSRSQERLGALRNEGLVAYYFDIDSLDTSDEIFLDADVLIINITSKNVESFEQLISKIETCDIKHVLFISSTSVYKNQYNLQQPEIVEDDLSSLIPCPLLSIENLFRKNTHFKTSIIRFSGLIGYQRHPGNFFLETSNPDAAYCKTIKNPDAPINMIHRDDCIGLIKALIKQQCWGSVFNACSSHHPSRREFYRAALKHLGGYEPIFAGQSESVGKVISNKKITDLLNYSFLHNDLLNFNVMPFDKK